MLEKSLERRRVNKEHNSNFRAGHVAVHEAHLHKTGLRGRKGYLAVCFLLCLALVAVINFVLTLWILHVVQINRHGSGILAFLSDGTVRFQIPSYLGLVHLSGEGSFVGGFKDHNIELSSSNETLTLKHSSPSGPKVELSGGDIAFQGKGGFQVINPATGKRIFSPEGTFNLKFLPEAKLHSEGGVEVSKIVSPTGQGLQLQSERYIDVYGSEGVSLRAWEMSLSGKNVDLIGVTKISVESHSSAGIYLNTSLLPKKLNPSSQNDVDLPAAYRLCICGNNGRLFKVKVTLDTVHPCQELSASFSLCQ